MVERLSISPGTSEELRFLTHLGFSALKIPEQSQKH